jgi:hypothetical protein
MSGVDMERPTPLLRSLALALLGLALLVGPARAGGSVILVDAFREVQILSDATGSGGHDSGSGDESSLDFTDFVYALSAPVNVGSASALAAAAQDSRIGVSEVHCEASMASMAEISDIDGFASAFALNEFRLRFGTDPDGGEVPYTFAGYFAASEDLVVGRLYLSDLSASLVLHEFNAPLDSTAFDFSGVLLPNHEYELYARLEAGSDCDPFGDWSQSRDARYRFDFVLLSGVASPLSRPGVTRLNVWPNPFGARASVSVEGQPYQGWLRVHDLRGRLVREFPIAAGQRHLLWDGRDSRGEVLPAGNYFLRLAGTGRTTVRKVTLLR